MTACTTWKISLTEESGDLAPIVRRYNNINLSADDNCSTTVQGFKNAAGTLMANNTIVDTITLDAGSWIIRKTLTINEPHWLYKSRPGFKRACARLNSN